MDEIKITKKDELFAKRLRRVRKQANVTQEQLSEKTGLSTTFIGLLEVGQKKPSLKSLQKIASALNVKVKDLFPY